MTKYIFCFLKNKEGISQEHIVKNVGPDEKDALNLITQKFVAVDQLSYAGALRGVPPDELAHYHRLLARDHCADHEYLEKLNSFFG